MWQRFTERARKIIFFAQEEAQHYGEGFVGPEHILLGVLREDDSTAVRVLKALGIQPSELGLHVRDKMPGALDRPVPQDMTLTPSSKQVIDLAYDSARKLNVDFIGSEHLLLGISKQNKGLAAGILKMYEVTFQSIWSEVNSIYESLGTVRRYVDPQEPTTTAPQPDTVAAVLANFQKITPDLPLVGLLSASPQLQALLHLRNIAISEWAGTILTHSKSENEANSLLAAAIGIGAELAQSKSIDPGYVVLGAILHSARLREDLELTEVDITEIATQLRSTLGSN